MHASLAFIGRACTVDDDEPPETPTAGSMDSLSDGLLEKYPQPFTEPFLHELFEGALSLIAPIGILPILGKAVTLCQELTTENKDSESVFHLCPNISPSDPFATDRTVHLTRFTRLHRLCELSFNATKLDLFASAFGELGCGLVNLIRHAENTSLGEYGNLERCVEAVFRLQNLSASSAIDQRIRCTQGHHSTFHRPTGVVTSGQLVELRVLCESLRQSSSQIKQFLHDKNALCHLVCQMTCGPLISSMWYSNLDALFSFVRVQNDRLSTTSLVAAHHLVYSGLSLLAHTELIRFAYGDLWEMLRGMEELDILNNTINIARQNSRTMALMQTLLWTLVCSSSPSLIGQLMRHELLCDPVLSVSPISIGYLFALIAHQRSIRLSCAVYRELFSILNYNASPDTGSCGGNPDISRPKHTLLEAFRCYLNEQYHRNGPEYLRAEYDFIASFLDILSQSTNLLHQVEKLKVMCTVAADVQNKKTGVDRGVQPSEPSGSSFLVPDTPNSFRAVSVEGKHGILIRRNSGDKTSQVPQSTQYFRSPQDRKNFISQCQDALHRACTFDRYVAAGSISCPPTSFDEPTSHSDENDIPVTATETLSSTGKHGSKKVVQWSDHREISTRHQVIGRFLEMTWYYTETLLSTLVLSPPASSVAVCQACDLPPCKQATHDPNLLLNLPATNTDFTTCLRMSPERLHRLSRRIRETAKAGIFPTGLVPALTRQALLLDELAYRRCCYADLVWCRRYAWTSAVSSVVDSSSTLPQHPELEFPTSLPVTRDTAVEDVCKLPELFFLSKCNVSAHDLACSSATAKAVQQGLSSSPLVQLDTVCKSVQFLPVLQSKDVCVCLTSLLHLTFICARIHSHLIPNNISQQIALVEEQLRVLGLKFPSPQQTMPPAVTQRVAVIQSAYEASRRIGKICHLLQQQISSVINRNHLHCLLTFDRLQNMTRPEAIEHADFADIRLASRLIILYTAEVFQLHTLIHSVLQLTDSLVGELRASFSRISASNEAMTYQRDHPQQLTFVLSDGIRLAATIARLSKTSQCLLELQTEVLHSYIDVYAGFASACEQSIARCWSAPLVELSTHPLSTKLLGDFLNALQCILPDKCLVIDLESHPLGPDNPPYCHFHQSVYTSLLKHVFNIFCCNWLKAVVHSGELGHFASDSPDFMHNHAVSVKNLRDALFDRQTSMPVALLAAFCECSGFCQLQTSVPGPYEMLTSYGPLGSHSDNSGKRGSGSEGLPYTSVCQQHCVPPDSLSDRLRSNSGQPFQRVKKKLTSRFNAPGDALSALAAGVKSNLINPLKGFTGIDNVPRRTISSEPLSSTLLNPFRSRTSSNKKS